MDKNTLILTILPIILSAIVTYKSATGAVKRQNDQALESLKSELARNAYASSKRADIKFRVCQRLNKKCGEIYYYMQRLIPDDLGSIYVNYSEKPSVNDLALAIKALDIEINTGRAFVSNDVIESFEELSKQGEIVIGAICKFNEYDVNHTKESISERDRRENEAYEGRKRFMDKWQNTCKIVNNYLLEYESL